jgi:DNA-binding CsgD family transcriptional regulator
MSSIQRRADSATELRLDYEEISAGRLVIVIQGLPTLVGESFTHPDGGPTQRDGAPASPLIEEADAIYSENADAPVLGTSLVLAAWRGQEVRASELMAAAREDTAAEEDHRASSLAEYAKALLCNGFGRYQEASAAATRASIHEDRGLYPRALLELVEAGARSNAQEVASEGLDRLEAWARASGTDWALGIRARSAALLTEGGQAEDLYLEAIDLLGRSSGMSPHLARARLVYGEWLRRENRRVDARVQFRAAHEVFSRISVEGFAERTVRELLATGETARKRTDEARAFLTPQEAQIARLAQDGFSNPEIGAQLFISPRTVQYHLRKVFLKLEISSRHQLGRVAPSRLEIAA